MKIVVNYDLLDKLREAETGVSLARSFKRTLFYTGIQTPFVLIDKMVDNDSLEDIFTGMLICLFIHTSHTVVNAALMAKIYQSLAVQTINSLLIEFNNSCIKTDHDNLMNAYKYKTIYDVDYETFPPKIEQVKYIMIPIEDDWGKREMSIVQEHTIGSNKYVLSTGSPEKKVYRLAPRTMKRI